MKHDHLIICLQYFFNGGEKKVCLKVVFSFAESFLVQDIS